MNRKELIKKYIEFFKSKNHKLIPNVSLIPENDPSALFISAGMHPLVPFLLGQPHPSGKRLCSVQKCVRTTDIEEVGDETHLTFFEMLGNWSLGDYWKKGALKMTFDFYTKILKIPKERLAITIFAGDKDAPKDQESRTIWKTLGIDGQKIINLTGDNWWGPVGKTGPCGPCTEIFYYWKFDNKSVPDKLDHRTFGENYTEIGNNVLMGYIKNKSGKIISAKQKNIDFGGGIERTIAALQGLKDIYLTECFKPIIKQIEKIAKKPYKGNEKAMRIIADHIKAAVFILAEGIVPSNTEQGYVLRRLIRRVITYGRELKIKNFVSKVAEPVFKIYEDYPELKKNKKEIIEELKKEEEKFLKTLEKGIRFAEKIASKNISIPEKDSFLLYQSYGIPIEVTKEIVSKWGSDVDEEGFKQELKKHQELSRTATAGRFKSGLADHSDSTTKLHTAAHLLLAALRKVLKNDTIIQKGSNITPERLRLDFSFPRKLTEDEIKKTEDLVNKQIQKNQEVKKEEMSPQEAKKSGAVGSFDEKYGDKVSIYSVGNFSKEICAGPHVKNTKEIGKFKIKKEESVGAGARRIKAILG